MSENRIPELQAAIINTQQRSREWFRKAWSEIFSRGSENQSPIIQISSWIQREPERELERDFPSGTSDRTRGNGFPATEGRVTWDPGRNSELSSG